MRHRIERKIKKGIAIIVTIFPTFIKNPVYRTLLGYKIGKDVKIGRSLICADSVIIQDHVRIGDRNKFLNIPSLKIGSFSTVGNDNNFISSPEFISLASRERRKNNPQLIIGRHCGISYNNFFDIQDDFVIGDYTTIAGINSVFFTHFIDVRENFQSTRPVRIGKYCMIGSSVRVVPGSSIPDYSVVGMGSVVTKAFAEEYSLIGGNPARLIHYLPQDAKYFNRKTGYISHTGSTPFSE